MLLFFSRFLLLLLLYYFYLATPRHVDRGFIIAGDEGEERRLIDGRGKKSNNRLSVKFNVVANANLLYIAMILLLSYNMMWWSHHVYFFNYLNGFYRRIV